MLVAVGPHPFLLLLGFLILIYPYSPIILEYFFLITFTLIIDVSGHIFLLH